MALRYKKMHDSTISNEIIAIVTSTDALAIEDYRYFDSYIIIILYS